MKRFTKRELRKLKREGDRIDKNLRRVLIIVCLVMFFLLLFDGC